MARSRRLLPLRVRGSRAALAALLAGASGAAHASITGVCPDGSIFIVQTPEAVPCSGAKRVEPGEIPPLKPELLPRPYTWEVFQQQQDPNNPYNLIDAARQVREARAAEEAGAATPRAQGAAVPPAEAPSRPQAATPAHPVHAAQDRTPVDLGLSDDEARDLASIVDLSQQRAPAGFVRDDEGAAKLVVKVAPSAAFEARLREAWARRGRSLPGPVLLYTVHSEVPGPFHPNFTFVQGHQAFHPDPEDPTQHGVVRGNPAVVAPGAGLLGYVVLPAQVTLGQPLDIYWDDRQITATLRP